jgi:hypothetical protein
VSSRASKLSLRVFGVLLAVCVLWLTFRDVDARAVQRSLEAVGPVAVLLLVPHLCWLMLEAAGWQRAFALLGRRLKFLPLLRVRVATEALSLSLPGGVVLCESVAPLLLAKHTGISLTEGVAGVAARKFLLLASQAAYVFAIFLFGATYLASSGDRFGLPHLPWMVLGGATLLAVAAAVMRVGLVHGSVVTRLHGLLIKVPSRRVRAYLEERQGGFSRAEAHVVEFFSIPTSRLLGPGAYFFACWLIESIETWLFLRIIGIDLDFVTVASFEVLVVLLRHVFFVLPAGLGLQDAGYVAFLAALGLPDPVSAGATYAVLKRSKEALFSLLGYGLLLSERQTHGGTPGEARPELARAEESLPASDQDTALPVS